MRLFDIVSAPWAISPQMLDEVRAVYFRHARGESANLAALEASLGIRLQNKRPTLEMRDAVAIVPMEGVLAKRMNMMMDISGGQSMQQLGNMLRAAADDPEVRGIVLLVDSPGGTVDGTQELADTVRAISERKAIVTLADGAMLSAAYWVGSAAQRVFISNGTTEVGSIGVVAKHVDISAAEEKDGRKTTEITAGKYKRIASSYAPLTAEGRASLQEQADYYYSLFVEAVAENRGVSAGTVLESMADGKVFIGQQAVAAGLVDGVTTLDALIARMNAGEFNPKNPALARATQGNDETMDLNQLRTEHADVYKAVVAEAAAAERARILGIQAHAMPGHEALVAKLVADGVTTGDQAAAAILTAERAAAQVKLGALREDAAEAGKVPASAADPSKEGAAAAAAAAAEAEKDLSDEGLKKRWEASKETRAEYGNDFDAFAAFTKAHAGGKVKILGAKKTA